MIRGGLVASLVIVDHMPLTPYALYAPDRSSVGDPDIPVRVDRRGLVVWDAPDPLLLTSFRQHIPVDRTRNVHNAPTTLEECGTFCGGQALQLRLVAAIRRQVGVVPQKCLN